MLVGCFVLFVRHCCHTLASIAGVASLPVLIAWVVRVSWKAALPLSLLFFISVFCRAPALFIVQADSATFGGVSPRTPDGVGGGGTVDFHDLAEPFSLTADIMASDSESFGDSDDDSSEEADGAGDDDDDDLLTGSMFMDTMPTANTTTKANELHKQQQQQQQQQQQKQKKTTPAPTGRKITAAQRRKERKTAAGEGKAQEEEEEEEEEKEEEQDAKANESKTADQRACVRAFMCACVHVCVRACVRAGMPKVKGE